MEATASNVAAALILSVPATISAIAAWRSSKRIHRSMGTSNGRGNVVQILERLDDRTVRLEERASRTEERLTRIESNTDTK